MEASILRSMRVELEKLAVRLKVLHGTNGPHEELRPGAVKKTNPRDPNPTGIYVGTSARRNKPHIEQFAIDAAKAHGGDPYIAHAVIDTHKGWRPHQLTAWGRENIGSAQEAMEIVNRLDAGVSGLERKELWEKLQRGVGSWKNLDPSAKLRPSSYHNVKEAAVICQ